MKLTAAVDREEALAFLGYRGQALDDGLQERLGRVAELVESELTPRGVYREMDAAEALALLPGQDIARHVQGCDRAVLMAVTLGAESEMLLRREQALSATDGLLADACTSSLVEQAANGLDALIGKEAAARGLTPTSRFSPGYGDLPLSCQPAFLIACGADRALGLRATEANLLVPAKSITAVIGLRGNASKTAPVDFSQQKTAAIDLGMASAETALASAETALTSATDLCSTCQLFDTCALRARGRTCHGNLA